MIDAVIYNLNNIWNVVIMFLVFILICGLILYMMTKKFNIHKKSSMYGGLIAGFNRRQTIMLCSIIIRTFLIIYAAVTYNNYLIVVLTMIFIADLVYMICNPKKLILESINIIGQIIVLYLNNILINYRLEISDEMYVTQVQLGLTIFIIIYAIYFLLKNFEETIKKRSKKAKKL